MLRLLLLFLLISINAEATVQVLRWPSNSPTQVCIPSDSNSNCGGGSTNITINTTSPVTGAGTGTSFTIGVDATKLSGTAPNLTAGTVTTNANLTGDVTSSGNATTLSSSYTGWTDGGTNIYTSTTTDIVGIGTTTPNTTTFEIVKQSSVIPIKISSSATGNGDYFIVSSSGNIGIGTPFPAASVQFASSDSTAYTEGGASTSRIQLYNTNTTNNNFTQIGFATKLSTGALGSMGLMNVIATDHTSGTSTGDWALSLRNNNVIGEKLRLKGSGNFGIGTNAPNSLLTVHGNAAIGGGTAYNTIAAPSNGLAVQGNVGIGTWVPNSPLTIYGSAVMQKLSQANQACATTCGSLACFFGENTDITGALTDCADATADVCFCSK